MTFTYNIRQATGVTVVDLSGKIVLNESTPSQTTLHQLVRDLVKEGSRNILLNLRDVISVDSLGIGQLFGCLTTVQDHGGILKLSHPNERVETLLRLTKLDTVIDVMNDEFAAIRSFSRSSAA